MRKYFLLIMLGCSGYASADSDVSGHTFFSVRPLYQSAMPEKISLFRGRSLARESGYGGAFDLTFFGGRTGSSKGLGKFFSPDNKNELIVDSDDNNLLRDINPIHFNIQYGDYLGDSYSSNIEFRPRQTVFGFGITYQQYLGFNDCCERAWWLEIGLPIYHVRNDMHLTETDVVTSGDLQPGRAPNMIEAFKGNIAYPNGQTWLYGKIDGKQKKTRVAEVEIKIGYDYLDCDTCHLDGYFGVIIPASRRPNAEFVFEAIPGNNFHGGFCFGASYGFLVWENCDKQLFWEIDTHSRYLLRNTQTRSFDLKNRPWSRYMLTIADKDAAIAVAQAPSPEDALDNLTPGINIFTRKVHVHPRFSFTINNALVYDSCGFTAELGYGFWARQREKVKLKDPWVEGPAIANLDRDAFSPGGNIGTRNIVNRLSNIGDDNLGAGVLYRDNTDGSENQVTIIREQDLNLQSAAHPCAISHLVYLTAGYHWDDYCYPMYAGLGGSYEFSAVNTAVNRWTLWGKFGISI
jgi:hypothetical protein